MNKTFVGFGFGPIQSGLFVYEAGRSGHFARRVVAEVDDRLVQAVGANGGRCTVNIARPDGVEAADIEGLELYNPTDAAGRKMLVEALVASDELATCLPSVDFYDLGGSSVAALLGEGLAARPNGAPVAVYAAENHNHAAEALRSAVAERTGPAPLEAVAWCNTVIGKMSGVIADPAVMAELDLAPLAPGLDRAVLVEAFNRILISRPGLAGWRRGLDVFIEKPDLLPFEEAKLYGHNAVHALIGYLADLKGCGTMAQAGRDGRIMDAARRAFLDECGPALISRHAASGDPLFTPPGWGDYAEDLLGRMVNPYLHDLVQRVGRDHVRKLGYGDRLFGTMRLALAEGVEPKTLALGAAAGVVSMIRRREELDRPLQHLPGAPAELTEAALADLLRELWSGQAGADASMLIEMTWRRMDDALGLAG